MSRLQEKLKRELELKEVSNETIRQLSRRLRTMEERHEEELTRYKQTCQKLKEANHTERLAYEKKAKAID